MNKNLQSGGLNADTLFSNKSTDCNNDLVLQGIVNLQKDINVIKADVSEIKTDIKTLNTNIADLKGDIKVIDIRLNTLDKSIDVNNNDIKAINSKTYLLYGGLAVIIFSIPYATSFLLK
jgi:septal ring factor EnvC (AmiA/AmiB activator)